MARSILLTLGTPLGATLGPDFNLTANVGVVTPSTATTIELITGKVVVVDDLATNVTITSTGVCTNAITQTIPCGGITTTTSTSTSTTTTTAAPGINVINYLINRPATGSYNYSFTPYSASIFPASFFTPTSSGVLSVINDSTRYAFSDSASLNPGTSIPNIAFNAISGTFICDAALLPYVTASVPGGYTTLCSGFSNVGTGSMTYVGCDGGIYGPINPNSDYLARVGTFPIGNTNDPTASFYGDGTFKPNPVPIFAGSNYEGAGYNYLNVVIYSPGYATQSMWIPTGTYTQINGVPIVAGTKVQYFRKSFPLGSSVGLGFGGTQTTVYPGLIRPYVSWDVHTYTASGDFTYRYQNQF